MLHLSSQFESIARLAAATEMRQRVISHNLANVNTPGYQALDVQFEQFLNEQTDRLVSPSDHPREPKVVPRTGLSERADGNNVDVDLELAQANKNSLLYQTYYQLMGVQLDHLRRAIQG